MRSNTKSKSWAMLTVLCAVALAVVLLFAGCANANSNFVTDNRDGNSTTITDGSIDGSTNLAGGSASTANGVSTANPETGYELSYWTRTKSSVTAKYATTNSVTVGSGESYSPVFVQSSTITEVSTAAELKTAMSGNKNIKLVKDIITTSSTFAPVDTFSGVLDGAGHKITINYTSTNANIGGLCLTLTGVIKNLVLDGKIEGSGTSASQAVGGFASAINGGLISYCANYAAISTKSGIAGGFVAKATNTTARGSVISNCQNFGSILGAKAGAIIFTNGTSSSPLAELVDNKNTGAIQTTTIA